jgi:hypothetical protein
MSEATFIVLRLATRDENDGRQVYVRESDICGFIPQGNGATNVMIKGAGPATVRETPEDLLLLTGWQYEKIPSKPPASTARPRPLE